MEEKPLDWEKDECEKIIREYARAICSRHILTFTSPDDVAQNAILKIYRKVVEGKIRSKSYLYAAVRSLMLDEVRRHKNRRVIDLTSPAAEDENNASIQIFGAADTTSVEEFIAAEALVARIRDLLGGGSQSKELDELALRTVIYNKVWGEKYKDIVKRPEYRKRGITETRLRVVVSRFRKNIAEFVETDSAFLDFIYVG